MPSCIIYSFVNREMFTKRHSQALMNMQSLPILPPCTQTTASAGLIGRIVIRFIKCQLYGMCIDWIEQGMTDDAYDDLHRMLELVRDMPELIVRRSTESDTV